MGVVVIVEGFRALAHGPLTKLMDGAGTGAGGMGLKLWLEISADTCRLRRNADPGNGLVSQETFEEALWPRHLEYRDSALAASDSKGTVHLLDAEQAPAKILHDILA